MNKGKVIKRLCTLSAKVGNKALKSKHSHDCFCHQHLLTFNDYSEKILKFIEDATNKAIKEKLK